MAEARSDADPYERALAEPAFLCAVTAAHRGRWRVLDGLWWWSHPAEAAPSGSAAPAARLTALQRRAFGADGDAAGDGAVAAAIRELEAEIAAERRAIGAALAAALAEDGAPDGSSGAAARPALPGAAALSPAALSPNALSPAVAVIPAALAPAAPRAPTSVPPRRRWLLGAALGTALMLGTVVGSQVAAVNGSTTASNTEPTTEPTTSAPTPATAAVPAVRVFNRDQAGQDIPGVPLPAAYDPASFRYLGAAGWRDADADGVTDSPYYAARGAANLVCLVVVPDGAGYLTACAPEDDFPPGGLRLSWQGTELVPAHQDGRPPMVMDLTVAWMSDSTVQTRGSARALIP